MRIWLFFAALTALIAFLYFQFPGALKNSDTVFHLVYTSLLTIVVGGSVLASHQRNWSRDAKFALWWVVIIFALVLGYSYRHELGQNRLIAELIPSRAQTLSNGEIMLRRGADGHFHVMTEVNGKTISFLIDTGASDVVLTPNDARTLGLHPETLAYTRGYHTANGTVSGAPVMLEEVTLSSIYMTRVEASVNKAQMEESLLGMTFFNRLKGFKVEGDVLTLQP